MSFGLSRGRKLDPGAVGVTGDELPPLPDEAIGDPEAGRLDPRLWFAEQGRPLEIEIGSGKGTFLVQQAAARPGVNYLGVEWAREFYLYAADRCRRRGLANVRMVCGDAAELLRWRIASGVASVIHLYFPDPWPKKKHHRRRIVRDRFLEDCARVLEQGGELRVVTDHADYWSWMEQHFARWCGEGGAFERLAFDRPESAEEGELVGTNFERKYRREGRPFHGAVLRKP